MNLIDILQNSAYSLSLFTKQEIDFIEANIKEKETKKGIEPYFYCQVRLKEIKLTPEEVVRQLYLYKLINHYQYPTGRIKLEFPVNFGRETKRADIVIMDKLDPNVAYILVEVKKPKAKDGRDQLKSYCHGTGATMGVWTNGESITYHHRKNPNYFEDIPEIPKATEKLEDILQRPFKMADLVREDKLKESGKSLKDLVQEMENEVLANAGVDVFEEVFKLIFAKLYDEYLGANDESRNLEFRNTGLSDAELKEKIQLLFDRANKKWDGVFETNAKLNLTPSHLSICVSSLETVKLFNSNLDVVDEAFEYLIGKSSKGEKGQYFTPRYVIDMCVKMMNPTEDDYVIDTAAGSSGFPVHAVMHVWKQMFKKKGKKISHLFTAQDKPQYCKDYVVEKVFAIDFDEKAVRVGRTLNLIAGDGQTNVLHLNTLDFSRWKNTVEEDSWEHYLDGFKRLKKLRQTTKNGNDFMYFNFDVLMANPPFAGDIKESQILSRYELAMKNGKASPAVGRDILFIERNLNFLKPGGRMAIVLPQGRFNNSSDKYIRDFIAEHCRILAVVGLHGNTFKPHTGTKTSVLFCQKWDDELCPKTDDYNIFFATQQLEGKNNSGDKLFWKKPHNAVMLTKEASNETGRSFVPQDDNAVIGATTTIEKDAITDQHGHPIVYHDLFATINEYDDDTNEQLTPDGIAEAFIEFAKKEQLSFFA
jgi:type I restriction enzyme M protein